MPCAIQSRYILAVSDLAPEQPVPADAILLDYFDKDRRMRGVAQTHIGGPGFSFRFGENNVLGLSTAVREISLLTGFHEYSATRLLAKSGSDKLLTFSHLELNLWPGPK